MPTISVQVNNTVLMPGKLKFWNKGGINFEIKDI